MSVPSRAIPARATPNGDLKAPDSVPEGSTSTIEIEAPTSTKITVSVSATGEQFDVVVENGKARFELPSGAIADTTILIVDSDDYSNATGILITPASE